MDTLSRIGAVIVGIGLLAVSLLLVAPSTFSAALPSATAVFETSLAAPISSSATSMTLTANAIRGGGALSGYNCFSVDEGSSQAETICGTVSGTSVTSLTRGISQITGTTTDADLQFSHRRGASVKITDFPVIQILKAQNNGEDTFANILRYASHPTFIGTTDIVDKKYVDDTAFSGAAVIDATTAARGVVELATAAEQAASTAAGSSGPLVLTAQNATSTFNSATAANRAVITDVTGKIDPYFIATSSLFSAGAASTTLTNNGSNSYSWSRPTNLFATTTPVSEQVILSGTASTTIFTATVPANVLKTGNAVRVSMDVSQLTFNTGGTDNLTIEAAYGNSTTTLLVTKSGAGDLGLSSGKFTFVVSANQATNSQKRSAYLFTMEEGVGITGAGVGYVNRTATSTSAIDSTAAQTLRLVASFSAGTGGTLSVSNVLAELLTY